jgi:NAD(P)-dependent dehydrogenase (short-subunit alcohol dehydrogenase family)
MPRRLGRIVLLWMDVTSDESIQEAYDFVAQLLAEEHCPGLDLLVNNAGVLGMVSLN